MTGITPAAALTTPTTPTPTATWYETARPGRSCMVDATKWGANMSAEERADLDNFLSTDYREIFDVSNPTMSDAINMVGAGGVTTAVLDIVEPHRIRPTRTAPKSTLPKNRAQWIRTRIQMDTGAQTSLAEDPTMCYSIWKQHGAVGGIGHGNSFPYTHSASVKCRIAARCGATIDIEPIKPFRLIPEAREFLFNPKVLTQQLGFTSTEGVNPLNNEWGHVYRQNSTGYEFLTTIEPSGDEFLECEVLSRYSQGPESVRAGRDSAVVDLLSANSDDEDLFRAELERRISRLSAEERLHLSEQTTILERTADMDDRLAQAFRLHCIGGHRHSRELELLCKRLGISVDRTWEIWCTACRQGSMKTTPITTIAKLPRWQPPMRPPGRKWSCDAAGPFETSILGNRFMYVLVEDDLKTAFPYFTANLATFRKISELMVEDIRQTMADCGESELEITISLRHVHLKADQAKYFTSESNHTHFKIHGITFDWVGVYSSQLACYAERVLGTLLSMAFKCRHHANAPKAVWDLAVLYNWEVYDNWPHSGIEGSLTPKQNRGQGLDNIFEFLHIFWAVAAVWIPKSKRNKSESKCSFGRYAGFDRQSRSHWVVVPTRSPSIRFKLIRSQHVQVDPRPFPPRSSGVLLPQVFDITPALNMQADQERSRTSNRRRNKENAILNLLQPGQQASVQSMTKGWVRVDIGGRVTFVNKHGQSFATPPALITVKGEAYKVEKGLSSLRSGNTVSNKNLPALLVPTAAPRLPQPPSVTDQSPSSGQQHESTSEQHHQPASPTPTENQPSGGNTDQEPGQTATDWREQYPVGAFVTARYKVGTKHQWFRGTVEGWHTELQSDVDVDIIRVKFSGGEFENFSEGRAHLHSLQISRSKPRSNSRPTISSPKSASSTSSPATVDHSGGAVTPHRAPAPAPIAQQLTPVQTTTTTSSTPKAKRKVDFNFGSPVTQSRKRAKSPPLRRSSRISAEAAKLTTDLPEHAFDRLSAAQINAELSQARLRRVTRGKADVNAGSNTALYNEGTDPVVRRMIDIACTETEFSSLSHDQVRSVVESPDGDVAGYSRRLAEQPLMPPESIDFAQLVTEYADNGQDDLADEAFLQADRHNRWVFADAEFDITGGEVQSTPITSEYDHEVSDLVQNIRRSVAQKANHQPLQWTNKVWYSYKQAANDPEYGHIFRNRAYIDKEVNTLERHGTITVCPRSETHGHKLHRLLVLISLKRRSDPSAPDYLYAKLRIVFDGKQAHVAGIAATSIPGLSNVRLFFSFTLQPDEIAISCDIPCAYSQTVRTDAFDASRRIYAELPYPMWKYDEVTRLLSTGYIGNLYGRTDAGLQHEIDRNRHINSKGYRNCKLEPAFIIGKGQRSCVLTDDFITIGKPEPANEFYDVLERRYSEKPGDLKKEIIGDKWIPFNGALIRRIGNTFQWSTR